MRGGSSPSTPTKKFRYSLDICSENTYISTMKKIKKLSGVDKVIYDTMKEVIESQIMPSSLAGIIVIKDTGTGFIVKLAKKKKKRNKKKEKSGLI